MCRQNTYAIDLWRGKLGNNDASICFNKFVIVSASHSCDVRVTGATSLCHILVTVERLFHYLQTSKVVGVVCLDLSID
jgi:hypothetical protein